MDKDSNEINAIKDNFSHVSTMLCAFHVHEALKAKTQKLQCSKEIRQLISPETRHHRTEVVLGRLSCLLKLCGSVQFEERDRFGPSSSGAGHGDIANVIGGSSGEVVDVVSDGSGAGNRNIADVVSDGGANVIHGVVLEKEM
ncbi:hypothetical protein PoB_005450900 [Plakobranchus ocellatus]|uniref:MULE transposase domain-containing protein n=1 Tax=Plakobranchus ocellatus TaxID=259542 RepID=A0AAV4CBD2_9GAST|nr:hypothetical protein PoB_005450900 [Plakobranchus ocellatus]